MLVSWLAQWVTFRFSFTSKNVFKTSSPESVRYLAKVLSLKEKSYCNKNIFYLIITGTEIARVNTISMF